MQRRERLMLISVAVVLLGGAAAVARVDNETDPLQHTRRMLELHPQATYDPESVLVRFDPSATPAARAAIRALVGGTKLQEWWLVSNLEHVKVQGDVKLAVATLNATPGVMYAELDWFVRGDVTPNDPSFGLLWGLNNTGQTVNGDQGAAGADINGPEAWNVLTGSSSFVIADIDSGVNYTHPDLAANIWTNSAEAGGTTGVDDDGNGYVDDVRGWNFVSNNNNPNDDNGHGTHTSGTFGAVGNNGVGVAGVMWSCRIMPLKFLNSSGSGAISGALSALQYAVAKGVRVSNNSWGGGGFSQSFLNAINASQTIGHIFVAAAGNASSNNDASASYPASYTSGNIIAVVATNNNDGFASFSNYGATSCDVGAPGVTIFSTYGSGYEYLDGTSMACPHVAGVVGLVYARNPTWSWSQVRTQVLGTARTVSALSGRCATGGVVNAAAALGATAPPPPPPPPGPANNACASAQTVAYGTTAFTTVGATTDGPAACVTTGNDVWFRFTACVSGTVTVQTCSLASWDTVVAVYSGSCGALTQRACNDDACGTQSRAAFSATAGQVYLIRVGGYNGATGTGSISVTGPSCSPTGPANNACASATVVGNGSFAGSTAAATNDGSASCGSSSTTRDVWYSYTATCTGVLTVDTCSAASYDTVLSVHTACPGGTGNQLACNDDGASGTACAGTLRSYINLNVTAGTTYKIRVAGYNGASGTFTLRIACGAGPANNECPCDWNHDGVVTSSDFFAFLTDFTNGVGDFDGSGEVTTQDFFDFLQMFFAPPAACGG
jgi:subtilisin family serine protease